MMWNHGEFNNLSHHQITLYLSMMSKAYYQHFGEQRLLKVGIYNLREFLESNRLGMLRGGLVLNTIDMPSVAWLDNMWPEWTQYVTRIDGPLKVPAERLEKVTTASAGGDLRSCHRLKTLSTTVKSILPPSLKTLSLQGEYPENYLETPLHSLEIKRNQGVTYIKGHPTVKHVEIPAVCDEHPLIFEGRFLRCQTLKVENTEYRDGKRFPLSERELHQHFPSGVKILYNHTPAKRHAPSVTPTQVLAAQVPEWDPFEALTYDR